MQVVDFSWIFLIKMMYHRMLITSLKVVSDLLLAVVSVILVLIMSIIMCLQQTVGNREEKDGDSFRLCEKVN